MVKPLSFLLFLVSVTLLSATPSFAQVLSPGSSSIVSPIAQGAKDATLTIGYGRLPAETVQSSGVCVVGAAERCDEILYFATLQFLPRVEMHYKQTFHDSKVLQATGDRTLGAAFRVLNRKRIRPALAIGVRDPAGTKRHHVTYAVASQRAHIGPIRASASLGIAFTVMDASYREMKDGLFFSAGLSFKNWITLLGDYDTRFTYAGVRIGPIKTLWVQGFVAEGTHSGFSFGMTRVLKK